MDRSLLEALNAARAARRRAALVTDLDDGRQVLVVDDAVAAGTLPLDEGLRGEIDTAWRTDKARTLPPPEGGAGKGRMVQVFNPPLRLMVVGAVHISQALAPMAALAGYAVTIIDPRRAWATEDRFPGVTLDRRWPDEALADLAPDRRTAIVTLTHDPKIDDPALHVALGSEAFYITALGSTKTHAKRVERLTAAGIEAPAIARLHAPAGLDIGAVSPAEIAVSVLAQMTLALRGSKAARKAAEAAVAAAAGTTAGTPS